MKEVKYYKKITAKNNPFNLKLKELFIYRELVGVLTKRAFQTRYRQTVLGPLWLIISPLFNSFVSFLVFGGIAHLGTGEIPPVLFYVSGTAVWSFFSGCLNKNAFTFRNNHTLFSKVYFPRLAMSVSYVLSDLIDFAIKLSIVVVLTVYYCIVGEIKVDILNLLLLPIIMIFVGILAMSIGILVSSLTTKYRDFSVLLSFVMTLWMPITPVAYPLSEISNPIIRTFFYINPMTGFMELFRFSLFGKGEILTENLIFSCVLTMVLAFFSIAVFNKVERNFTDTI